VALPGNLASKLGPELLGWVDPMGCVKIAGRQSLDAAAMDEMDTRGLLYGALELDQRGGVRIPEGLLEAAGVYVNEPCVLVGMGQAVELWDAERYSRYATEAFGSG
jgi:DNA-binding transcriptional regulator/RsmH inhibitor MraZ